MEWCLALISQWLLAMVIWPDVLHPGPTTYQLYDWDTLNLSELLFFSVKWEEQFLLCGVQKVMMSMKHLAVSPSCSSPMTDFCIES